MPPKAKRAPSLTPDERRMRRRRALMRFKAVVRLVIANLYWIQELDELRIGDSVMKNIKLLKRKKIKKSSLTLKEKSILCKPKEDRTDEEKELLSKVIGGLKCFRRYPPNVKSQLAAVTYFVYIGPGREIVKQDQPPSAMYFILSGEAKVMVRHFDKLMKEWVEEDSGTIGQGTMFGEIALIHGIVRLATITTITPCELLMIKKDDFDLVLKDTVLKAWEEIQKIMNQFSYFKNCDIVTKRECSIVSRTKVFQQDETILGDGCGLTNFVHFIAKGSCSIVEHLVLKVKTINGKKHYRLYQSESENDFLEDDQATSLSQVQLSAQDSISNTSTPKPSGYSLKEAKSKRSRYFSHQKATSKHAVSTPRMPTLEYHDPAQSLLGEMPSKLLLDTAEDILSQRKISSIVTKIKPNVETHFIKVCDLTEGACFNIGEDFERRRVVAKTTVFCLLVPRYWILKNNKDNIWNRVQQFLNQHIPSTEEIFKHFVEEKRFLRYRRSLVQDILSQKKIRSFNSLHNVPYSIRLKEGTDDYIQNHAKM